MAARIQLPRPVNLKDLDDFARYAEDMLTELEMYLADQSKYAEQVKLHEEPSRLYDGLTVYADGSDWDPGSGEGTYIYHNGAWHPIGGDNLVTSSATLTADRVVVGDDDGRGVKTLDGPLFAPAGPGSGGDDEGGEVHLELAPNSTLNGTHVVFDQYIDVVRLFESGSPNRGFSFDFAGVPSGIVGLLSQLNLQVFTSNGTYTPTAGMKYCIVISTGGGGGGGGSDNTGASNDGFGGAGGAAGGTCISILSAAAIGSSQSVTVGAAGSPGSATDGTNGGNGGNTTFGSFHSAPGGNGGQGTGNTAANSGRTTGGFQNAASGGQINIQGGNGGDGLGWSGGTGISAAISGQGGTSFWGGPGRSVTAENGDANGGGSAQAPGSGGGGAACKQNSAGAAGGSGQAGIVVVIEFI